MTDQSRDPRDAMPDDFDADAGTFEGRVFPKASEWLDVEPPPDISAEFVSRTMAALRDPTPQQLEAFAPPPPAADFVARTLGAMQRDRLTHWRELLARYVAPAPSPSFVARTLHALQGGNARADSARAGGASILSLASRWALPLLAAAAVLAIAIFLPGDTALPIERRAADALPAAYAPAHAGSPLPAVLTILDRNADPYGLPDTGGDGVWLLLEEAPR